MNRSEVTQLYGNHGNNGELYGRACLVQRAGKYDTVVLVNTSPREWLT